MKDKLNDDQRHNYYSNPKDNKWIFSKVFCLPNKGELYRFVAIPHHDLDSHVEMYNGAVKLPMTDED